MAILDSISRLAATLIDTAHTRLELLAVDIETEIRAWLRYLLWSLIALFLAVIAVFVGVVLIIALFWDEHKIAAMSALLGLFGGGAIVIVLGLRYALKQKPPLLHATLHELRKDSDALRGRDDRRS